MWNQWGLRKPPMVPAWTYGPALPHHYSLPSWPLWLVQDCSHDPSLSNQGQTQIIGLCCWTRAASPLVQVRSANREADVQSELLGPPRVHGFSRKAAHMRKAVLTDEGREMPQDAAWAPGSSSAWKSTPWLFSGMKWTAPLAPTRPLKLLWVECLSWALLPGICHEINEK